MSPTLHPIYALGAAIRTLQSSHRGNKEHCTGQIRRALVHQAAPGGRDLQRGTSCVKANLLCSCSRIQGQKNHPKTRPSCWPLGASKGPEESSYRKRRTIFFFGPAFVSPKPSPVLHYPNFILMFLGDLLFSFFDILENKNAMVTLRSQQGIFFLLSSPP